MQGNTVGVRNLSLASPPQLGTRQTEQPNIRQTSFVGIISSCAEMQKVFNLVEKVARTNSTVLILGQSGTGKELIARALHRLSERSGKLVPVNCGAIPEEILESELFGHEKTAHLNRLVWEKTVHFFPILSRRTLERISLQNFYNS